MLWWYPVPFKRNIDESYISCLSATVSILGRQAEARTVPYMNLEDKYFYFYQLFCVSQIIRGYPTPKATQRDFFSLFRILPFFNTRMSYVSPIQSQHSYSDKCRISEKIVNHKSQDQLPGSKTALQENSYQGFFMTIRAAHFKVQNITIIVDIWIKCTL